MPSSFKLPGEAWWAEKTTTSTKQYMEFKKREHSEKPRVDKAWKKGQAVFEGKEGN